MRINKRGVEDTLPIVQWTIQMPELRIFYDLLSQPCRAVILFLEANKIPYETVVISLVEGKVL